MLEISLALFVFVFIIECFAMNKVLKEKDGQMFITLSFSFVVVIYGIIKLAELLVSK